MNKIEEAMQHVGIATSLLKYAEFEHAEAARLLKEWADEHNV